MNADNTENTARVGRRSTDNKPVEGVLPSSPNNFRSRLLIGFISLGGITALLGIGRASNTLDTAVAKIKEHDKKFEIVVARLETGDLERLSLLKSLENKNNIDEIRVKQQIDSDIRFEGMFKDSNEKLDKVIQGVNDNKIQIINLNKTSFAIDKTGVYLAMR